ncbi:hypothetical protein ACFQ1S_19390 [Kibdelosporangium lantanae]|uniref:Uncharacterized protein n=1 Tax=Kibdelosporangium lantanae TaxID=1497396 RepID=A0ABW3M9X4_9PSEU
MEPGATVELWLVAVLFPELVPPVGVAEFAFGDLRRSIAGLDEHGVLAIVVDLGREVLSLGRKE